jgi:hypothetical protein
MPKQVGLIKIKGTVDDLSFFSTQDGYMARKKGRFNADKLKNDPNYRQVRLNILEFSTGGNASRIFREAFTTEINKASDNRMISRLTQAMIAVLQTDTGNDWGYREVQSGDMTQLIDFNFNEAVPFAAVAKVKPQATIDRATGQLAVSIPAHIPQELIAVPANGVTHYRFFAAAGAIDFLSGSTTSARQSSASLVYDDNPGAAINLALPLTANSPFPLVIVVGIEFMRVVNGKSYRNSAKEAALQILAVDTPAALPPL